MQRLLDHDEFVLCVDADGIIFDLDPAILDVVDDEGDVWLAHHPQHHDLAATVANFGAVLARPVGSRNNSSSNRSRHPFAGANRST